MRMRDRIFNDSIMNGSSIRYKPIITSSSKTTVDACRFCRVRTPVRIYYHANFMNMNIVIMFMEIDGSILDKRLLKVGQRAFFKLQGRKFYPGFRKEKGQKRRYVPAKRYRRNNSKQYIRRSVHAESKYTALHS